MTPDACPEFVSLLVRAAEEPLGPTERATLDAHLTTCKGCRAALADQEFARAALAARPTLYASPEFAARVADAIDGGRAWISWLDFRGWTWRLVPVAAALSLAAWFVVRQPVASPNATPGGITDEAGSTLPVAAALWDESISDSSVLSLMIGASANDALPAVKER